MLGEYRVLQRIRDENSAAYGPGDVAHCQLLEWYLQEDKEPPPQGSPGDIYELNLSEVCIRLIFHIRGQSWPLLGNNRKSFKELSLGLKGVSRLLRWTRAGEGHSRQRVCATVS